jgi:hypothetical protein
MSHTGEDRDSELGCRQLEFTGEVVGLVPLPVRRLRRFYLLTRDDREERFDSQEHAIERLVTRGLGGRQVITVFALNRQPMCPSPSWCRAPLNRSSTSPAGDRHSHGHADGEPFPGVLRTVS